HPTLILSDIMMPKLIGIQLLKELKAKHQTKTIPVIFLSARAGEEATIEGMEAGADDYLAKPFSAKELIARVQANISLSSLRKKTEERIIYERQKLYDVLMQAPAMTAICQGSNLIYELANPYYLKFLRKTSDIIGKPLLEVFPEIKTQPIYDILNNVFETGKRFVGDEVLIQLDINNTGVAEDVYFNFVYEPLRRNDGEVDGIMTHAVDVTSQVISRKNTEEGKLELKGKNGQSYTDLLRTFEI
ncbi:MAG TPA: response regulator, partial [Flavobacterium sp.]